MSTNNSTARRAEIHFISADDLGGVEWRFTDQLPRYIMRAMRRLTPVSLEASDPDVKPAPFTRTRKYELWYSRGDKHFYREVID